MKDREGVGRNTAGIDPGLVTGHNDKLLYFVP